MNDNEFLIDHNFRPPEPFDRAIANLDVRCSGNSINDGLSLQITASFGSDFVEIELSDGGWIEVDCKIHEAIIVATPYNCSFTDMSPFEVESGFQYTQTFSGMRNHSSTAASELRAGATSVAGDPKLKADFAASTSKQSGNTATDQYQITGERKFMQVQFGQDQVRIFANPDKSPLEGNLVDCATCFRVVPNNRDLPFGVLVKLQVGRSWLSLSDAKPRSVSARMRDLFDKALMGTSPLDEFHRKSFQLLIEHLIRKGLQDTDSSKFATLAARAVRAVPLERDKLEHRFVNLVPRQLIVPVKDVEAVLFESREIVRKTLKSHGIAEDEMPGNDRWRHFSPGELPGARNMLDVDRLSKKIFYGEKTGTIRKLFRDGVLYVHELGGKTGRTMFTEENSARVRIALFEYLRIKRWTTGDAGKAIAQVCGDEDIVVQTFVDEGRELDEIYQALKAEILRVNR
jgi:hypothetical protein